VHDEKNIIRIEDISFVSSRIPFGMLENTSTNSDKFLNSGDKDISGTLPEICGFSFQRG